MQAFWPRRVASQDKPRTKWQDSPTLSGCDASTCTGIGGVPAMLRRLFLAAFFSSLVALAAPLPWDKPPEQWSEADVFRILRDSPWSPAKFSLESDYRQRRIEPQSGAVTGSPSQVQGDVVRGIVVSRGHPLPAGTGFWGWG